MIATDELTAVLATRSERVALAFADAVPQVARLLEHDGIERWATWGQRLAAGGWRAARIGALYFEASTELVRLGGPEALESVYSTVAALASEEPHIAEECLRQLPGILVSLPVEERGGFLSLLAAVAHRSRAEVHTCLSVVPGVLELFEVGLRPVALDLLRHGVAADGSGALAELATGLEAASGLWGGCQRPLLAAALEVVDLSVQAAVSLLRSVAGSKPRFRPEALDRWVSEGSSLLRSGNLEAAMAWFGLESSPSCQLLAELTGRAERSEVAAVLGHYARALSGGAILEPDLPEVIDGFGGRQENLAAYKVAATRQAGAAELGSLAFRSGPAAQRFFCRFAERELAEAVFAIVEGHRIDEQICRMYPGIRDDLRMVQAKELASRPALDPLPPREAFVEWLTRLSLRSREPEPAVMGPELGSLARSALEEVARPEVTVWHAAEITTRLVGIAMGLPRRGPFRQPPEPELRPVLRPELMPLPDSASLDQIEVIDVPGEGAQPAELAVAAELGDGNGSSLELIGPPGVGEAVAVDPGEAGAAPGEWFVYDEWDFRVGDYRQDWCKVYEHEGADGDPALYACVLERRRGLVLETRRTFEMMRPEAHRRVRRSEDGHEIDLDEAVTFHVERLAGCGPLARVYTRHRKISRDVALALLLDMSGSTAEAAPVSSALSAPAPGGRIIDVEKEALVVMIEALEALGDPWGLYGFSSDGRERVDLAVLKEIGEPMQERVRGKVAAIEPQRATRMGAAVRHVVSKLQRYPARVKILVVVSDGRPADDDYGLDHSDREYAVADTHQALREARRSGIEPFLITVDAQGSEYLGEICGEMGYEVVAEVEDLPRRLPGMYRRVAT